MAGGTPAQGRDLPSNLHGTARNAETTGWWSGRVRLPLLILALLLAGCASPAGEPGDGRPLDLTEERGTLLLDLRENRSQLLTTHPGLAWMSASGALVSWTEANYAVVLDRSINTRDVAPLVPWSRIDDDGTGLEMRVGEARIRELVSGDPVRNVTLPPTPTGRAWTYASDDLTVLGAEHADTGAAACGHAIRVQRGETARAIGCHLEVSRDGRVAWTEGDGVRILGDDGTATPWPPAHSATEEGVRHENPLFTANGTIAIRLRAQDGATVSEVVDDDGQVLATLHGPRELALLDVSSDARWLLVRVFQR